MKTTIAANHANDANKAEEGHKPKAPAFYLSSLFASFAWFAAISFPSGAQGGAVVTAEGRIEGAVAIQNGALQAAGKAVKWTDALVIVNDAPADAKLAAEALQLDNGEVWAGQVTKLAAGRITVESPLLGAREADLAAVRSIDFAPGLPVPGPEKQDVLYRLKGSPVQGKLVSLDAQRLAVETALGAVPLERKAIQRYVFAGAERKTPPPGDEVALVDGSVLFGQVTPAGAQLAIKHPVLGDLTVTGAQWRSVRRRGANVTHLAEATPAKLETFPLIRKPANPPQVERPRGGTPGEAAATYVCRMHIWPRTIAGYTLEGQPGQKVQFRAAVAMREGARGAALIRFRAGDKTLFETVLDPKAAKSVPVSFEADAGGVLSVEVDFDKSIRFPCSVTMDDPLILRK